MPREPYWCYFFDHCGIDRSCVSLTWWVNYEYSYVLTWVYDLLWNGQRNFWFTYEWSTGSLKREPANRLSLFLNTIYFCTCVYKYCRKSTRSLTFLGFTGSHPFIDLTPYGCGDLWWVVIFPCFSIICVVSTWVFNKKTPCILIRGLRHSVLFLFCFVKKNFFTNT